MLVLAMTKGAVIARRLPKADDVAISVGHGANGLTPIMVSITIDSTATYH